MCPEPICAQQNDAGAPDVFLRRVPIRNECFEPKAIRTGKREGDATAHPARLAGPAFKRIPTRTQPSDINYSLSLLETDNDTIFYDNSVFESIPARLAVLPSFCRPCLVDVSITINRGPPRIS